MKNVSVRYTGTKPVKTDTVTGSGAVWVGHGAVCDVPADVAAKLCLYPDVWVPADKKILRPTVPLRPPEEDEEPEGEPTLAGEDDEARDNDEHGFEVPPAPGVDVTVEEVLEMLPLLDREVDFTDTGKPAVAKVRERFPDRELSVATLRAAWDRFAGA